MPRANRYFTTGQIWHVTHRCHDRDFLLRFVRDRNGYRTRLREALATHAVDLFGYCLTSNHVHLLFRSRDTEGVPALMQEVAGEFAQSYNRRKKRTGAFWGDRYHATLVDTGSYLWRCLLYIDLNMVRAGVVSHPEEWDWCGYQELMGLRRRYRLIDTTGLLQILKLDSLGEFRTLYRQQLEQQLARGEEQEREPCWTESLALGSETFVTRVAETLKNRLLLIQETQESSPKTHVLRETGA